MEKIFTHPIYTVFWHLCRLVVGGLFLYAAVKKIWVLHEFVQTAIDYHVLPELLTKIYAYPLPFVELACALLLLIPVWQRFAAYVTILMLVSFIIALMINLVRGTTELCGCFGEIGLITWWSVWRDIGLLALTFVIAFFPKPVKKQKHL